ncbi:MAG: sigma-70 family RNA polymerase sigma factor [Bacteroidetes bacterium]|nr:sigma-70 family RNA polymerase sigma factor [Bacteroidota bacterium]
MAYKDDAYYIARIRQYADNAAFASLVNKHKTMAYNIALRITRSREDAEEVAQDAFVKVFQSLAQFKGDSKFTTWLFKVVYNLALTKIRKKSLISGSIDEDHFTETASEEAFEVVARIKDKEQKKYLNEAIAMLDESDQLLISLYYMNDLSVDEIAEITDLSASNIKVKLFRSRKKLHDELQRSLKDELHSIL